MSTTERECPTILLDDAPATEDAFGPHARIAQAIVSLIASEDGGRAVGLEGGWGAGKSTVVNFIRSRLHKQSECKLVSFDAWAHEGDPLRRTYLESVVEELTDAEWLDKESWDDSLEKLANRKKTTTTRTTPKPTSLGAVFAVSLVLVPLGTTLFRNVFDSQSAVKLTNIGTWDWLAWICVAAATAPLLVLLGNLLRVLVVRPIWNWGRRRLGWSVKTPQHQRDWAFLLSRAVEEVRTDTTETPNPTSIEFENYFTRAMCEALDGHSDRRLILVLDNLDRVGPSNAIGIWSTLQTFLQERTSLNAAWFKQVWVVVPYDPDGLRRIWDKWTDGTAESSSEELSTEERTAASDSFLDKSFQIRFQVPPPVLSDWKAYLCGLLSQALPQHGESDRHTIYRVYEEWKRHRALPPTPRELKLFVNQIGAIHRQWEHSFPIGHVAYFVLHSRDRRSLLQRLQSGDFPPASVSRLLEGNLLESLAGLFFNVAPQKGMELLLGDVIYDSLAEGSASDVEHLATTYGQSFWTVAEGVVSSRIADAAPAKVAHVSHSLYDSKLLEETDTLEAKAVRSNLKRAILAVPKWEPLDAVTVDGLSAIHRLYADADFSKRLMQAACESLTSTNSEESSTNAKTASQAFLQFCSTLAELGFEDVIPDSVTITGDIADWTTACVAIKNDKGKMSYWSRLKTSVPSEEIASSIQSSIEAGEFSEEHIAIVEITSRSLEPAVWDTVANAIQSRLDANVGANSDESRRLIQCLWGLRRIESARSVKVSKALVSGGHVAHHMHQMAKHLDGKALCALTLLTEDASLPAPPGVGNSASGHQEFVNALGTRDSEFASHLCTAMRRYSRISQVLEIIDKRGSYDPLLAECLRYIAEGSNPEEVFTNDEFLNRWSEIQDALTVDDDDKGFDNLLVWLVEERNLCATIQADEDGFSVDDAVLYWNIVQAASELHQSFFIWCKEGVENLDQDQWINDLQGSHECIWLSCLLADKGVTIQLTTHFLDALVDNAKEVVKGNHVPEKAVLDKWQQVKSFLEQGTHRALRTRVLSIAIEADGNMPEQFVQMYGDEFSMIEVLEDNHHSVDGLFSPIVRHRNLPGLTWLKSVLTQTSGLLDTLASKQNIEEFKTRLQDCVNDPEDDEAQELIDEVAELVGVLPEEQDEIDEGSSQEGL